jgi:hypothetical protein
MIKKISVLAILLLLTVFSAPHAYAAPNSADAAATEVIVAKQPLEIKSQDKVELEVLAKVQLKGGESKESEYIDVSGYEQVTLFVETFPESIFTEELTRPMYELNAYFSMTASTTKHRAMGGEEKRLVDQGVQEFGAYLVGDSVEGHSNFTKLTTGLTAGRALHTPVYGKYLRVTIANRTPGKTSSYRVVAYFRR